MSDEVLMEIQRSLGRIEAKADAFSAALAQHASDDKATFKHLFENVEVLKLASAKQKGALTVLGVFGSMLGAGVGYLVERFIRGN
jgi:hypothetical protein